MSILYNKLKTDIHQASIGVISSLSGPMTVSKFIETGEITPIEFEKAGDILVQNCPSWKWESGDPSKAVSYLPKNKQFLITRGVPCSMRISTLEKQVKEKVTKPISVDGDEGWYETSSGGNSADNEEILEINTGSSTGSTYKPKKSNTNDDDDEILDIDDAMNGGVVDIDDDEKDESTVDVSSKYQNSVIPMRSYDMSITYDNYYHTPRVWLSGLDENKRPLKPEEVLQDISSDHANKTVTIAAHPHLGFQCAFVHPCKHANVMNKIITRQIDSGKEPRVDHYLFLFLKFLSAVLPTIEYDYTVDYKG